LSESEKIPLGWETRRLKYAASYNDETLPETTEPDLEIAYVDISSVDLINGITAIEKFTFENAPSRARRKVKAGDTIISTVRTYLKAIASVDDPPANMIVSTGFAVIRPLSFINSRFLGYALQSIGFIDSVVANSTGVSYPAINPSSLVSIAVSYPEDAEEQKQIADFLDHKTAQIDALIAKKWSLIERLKEQRIAVITQAVNKGLDSSAPMRDSGLDWLGEVPESWDVLQIGRMITLQRGVDITKDEQEEGDVPVVSSGGIASYHSIPLMKGPGVIVGRKGTAGSVHYITSDYWPHDTTLYVKDFWGNHPRFVYYKLLSMNLASFDTGTANPTVNRNRVHPEMVSWPPVTEQPGIVSFLDRVTKGIDLMIGKVTAAINLLTEYRTALITAATTGKIDVRNVRLG
jgi:type I restriction enzyme S subunit